MELRVAFPRMRKLNSLKYFKSPRSCTTSRLDVFIPALTRCDVALDVRTQGVSAVDGRVDVTQRRGAARPPPSKGDGSAVLLIILSLKQHQAVARQRRCMIGFSQIL